MSADNNEGYCSFIAVTNPCQDRTNVLLPLYSLRSRRNFGERVLSNFITKIMVAIFDNNGSGKLRREINLYQGGDRRSKIRRGWGRGSEDYACPKSSLFCHTLFAHERSSDWCDYITLLLEKENDAEL